MKYNKMNVLQRQSVAQNPWNSLFVCLMGLFEKSFANPSELLFCPCSQNLGFGVWLACICFLVFPIAQLGAM